LLPLYRTWHVWFRGPHRLGIHRPERLPHDRQRSEITDIGNFGSIGDFWEWFNNLPGPSALWADCDLCFFQQGVGPAWEDPANANGGRWVVSAEQLADQRWESLCLDLVGETLDPGGEVTGVILGCRRPKRGPGYVRAAVWMRERTHDAAVLAVGHGCKGALGVAKLEFQDHPAEYNQVYRHAI
jgi:translation initiation factor 4E